MHAGYVEALKELGQQVATFHLGDRLDFYSAACFEISRGPDGQSQFRRALDDEQAKYLAANGLLSACYQFWPDVVLIVSAFYVPVDMMDLLRSRGHRVVLIHTEVPYENDRQVERAAHADLNLVTDPTGIDAFRAVAPTYYLPQAYRPSLHCPGPALPELECDFTMVGTGYGSRVEFMEAMDLDGLDVVLAGNWTQLREDSPLYPFVAHATAECLDNERAVDLYRSAKVGINLYRREADRPELSSGWACGPREIEQAACGLFFLRDPRPEGDELFPMLPTFGSSQEASELLRWYLAHEIQREEAAALARKAVVDRTFVNHARSLLRLLGQ